MKATRPAILATIIVAWFALAAPSEAGAFTGAAADEPSPGLPIGVSGGGQRFVWFSGRGIYFGRPLYDRHFQGSRQRSQGFRHFRGVHALPARAIVRSLRARRFHRISYPRLRRGLYHARARDAYGRRVRLVIDPYSGNILRLRYR